MARTKWAKLYPHHPHHQEEGPVKSFCLVFEEQVNWIGFGLWLSMLLNRHGANILRVKGILNIAGRSIRSPSTACSTWFIPRST